MACATGVYSACSIAYTARKYRMHDVVLGFIYRVDVNTFMHIRTLDCLLLDTLVRSFNGFNKQFLL